MKRYLISTLLFVFILVLASIYYFRKQNFTEVSPHLGNITEAVYGLGKVKSNKRFEVVTSVISTITKRHVNEGQLVEKGSPLIELDDHVLFRAPFKGTVTLVNFFQGETTLPQMPLLRLEDLGDRYIELSLEQQAILNLHPGLSAQVSFESLRGKIHKGVVTSVFPKNDEFLTRIDVKDLEPNILPGMSADVSIEIGKIENALLVPVAAITNGMLNIYRDNRWQKIKFEIGHVDGVFAEIKDTSLKLEDKIRMKGNQ